MPNEIIRIDPAALVGLLFADSVVSIAVAGVIIALAVSAPVRPVKAWRDVFRRLRG